MFVTGPCTLQVVAGPQESLLAAAAYSVIVTFVTSITGRQITLYDSWETKLINIFFRITVN